MKIVLFAFSLVSILSCGEQKANFTAVLNTVENVNSLDTILGDKYIGGINHIIRPNNFESLLKVSIEELKNPSKLYTITKIDSNFYLLQQKRNYNDARTFNIILKTDSLNIKEYYVVNDFKVIDNFKNDEDILLLCSDFENYNAYWKTAYQVKLIKIDSGLNENWLYSVKHPKYPLDANRIELKNGRTYAYVNIITGCHICFETVQLEMDSSGKCINAKQYSQQNSGGNPILSQQELDSLFVK